MEEPITERDPLNPLTEDPDPIVSSSLSGPMLIASLALIGTLLWALYDEVYGSRPWKAMQREFVERYTAYLKRVEPQQERAERALRQSAEFQKIEQQMLAAEREAAPRVREIDAELALLERQLSAVTTVFQDARAKIGALTYEWEVATSDRAKRSRQQQIEKARQGPYEIVWPTSVEGGRSEKRRVSFTELEEIFTRLKDRKAQLVAEKAQVLARATELRRQRDAYLQEHLVGLNREQIDGLVRKMESFTIGIKQIHVQDGDLVDRCESCHLGIREPLVLTAAVMGNRAFVSHPKARLLKIHDPERFGCSPCHGGNGRATSSVVKAHGLNKHWLWPLYRRENVEAGCLQCHFYDRVLEEAPVLTEGRDLFELKGCVGCHRYEGYDRESDGLTATRQEIRRLEAERATNLREMDRATKQADQTPDDAEARRLYALAESLRVRNSQIADKLEQLELQAKYLMQDQKKVGPNLKDLRIKVRPEWLPVWLENPQAFRPGTKMPRFRFNPGELQAIAAYLWQSGLEEKVPSQSPGDPVRGKELFETRGCMACHSIGEGDQQLGGTFAANLSRVGEKVNYDYLVRWIHNPRERLRPYCPTEKRDIGPQDYARRGLPFVFDLDHSRCPSCGHELQVQQMTVMPSLRLSWQEARDIASFLMTQKRRDASYQPAPFLTDARLRQQGALLIRRYGCAGCHEIRGLEEEPRIGTELTREGSKPLEQLDFALLTREAKQQGWYNHKGFFENKLKDPAIYDRGKQKPPEERLRMPNIELTPQQITALTTFLLGSVNPTLPPRYYYRPADQRRDIQEGWWIIKKYNCMGCHTIQVGQKSVLSTLPRYQDPDWKEQLPPSLIGEGARVNPDWLVRFLTNPALSTTDLERNGVRGYLKARMPTFYFSPNEVRILVRFFEALSSQPQPYIPPALDPLTDQERMIARQLFTSQAAPCLKCHMTGDPTHDARATAPNFLLARERLKPGWTGRWMIDPQAISPGTAMPSGLFKREGDRWVFAGPLPESLKQYRGDHVDLLVRYMFQFTPEEQRRLIGASRLSSASGVRAAHRAPRTVLPRPVAQAHPKNR